MAMPLNFVGVANLDLKTPGAHKGCSTISWENLEAWRLVEKGIDDALSWCRVYRERDLGRGDLGTRGELARAREETSRERGGPAGGALSL